MKKFIAVMLCVFMLASLAACSGNGGSGSNAGGNEGGSQSAVSSAELSGTDKLAEVIADNDVTLINVWATWCTPCVNELPELQKISEKYKNVGVVGILADGVNTETFAEDSAAIEAAKELMAEKEVDYTIVIPDKEIFNKYVANIMYFPTSYFVDNQGNIIGGEIIGANDEAAWSLYAEAALAAAEDAAAAAEAEAETEAE